MLIQDFSNFGDELLKFSKKQFENTNLLYYDDSNNLILRDNYEEILKDKLRDDEFYIVNFWIKFSIAYETFLKVILINNQIENVFVNAKKFEECETEQKSFVLKDLSNCTKSRFPDAKVIDVKVIDGKCYTIEDCFAQGIQVEVKNNHWMKKQFDDRGFKFSKQINTCTLGKIPDLIKSLLNQELPSKENEIIKSITHFTKLRRNRDMHMYFKNQTFIDNNDLHSYIKTINTLYQLI